MNGGMTKRVEGMYQKASPATQAIIEVQNAQLVIAREEWDKLNVSKGILVTGPVPRPSAEVRSTEPRDMMCLSNYYARKLTVA